MFTGACTETNTGNDQRSQIRSGVTQWLFSQSELQMANLPGSCCIATLKSFISAPDLNACAQSGQEAQSWSWDVDPNADGLPRMRFASLNPAALLFVGALRSVMLPAARTAWLARRMVSIICENWEALICMALGDPGWEPKGNGLVFPAVA